MVYNIDCWSRDAKPSLITAYLIPGLHVHFYFCLPLPAIVMFGSALLDVHVLMNSSVCVLNSRPLE